MTPRERECADLMRILEPAGPPWNLPLMYYKGRTTDSLAEAIAARMFITPSRARAYIATVRREQS